MSFTTFRLPSYIALGLVIFLFSSTLGQAQTFKSPEQAVPLIELFTSEGCSSCPPADRWMKNLVNSEHLWNKFVPMAFHVDYWDYIGWKDPFASREYSQRQRRYASEFNEPSVYTPGLRLGGKLWQRWYLNSAPNELETEKVGRITLEVKNSTEFVASFSQPNNAMQLNIAILGLGMNSQVTLGENRGKTLQHDFVVLGISRYSSATIGQWQGVLPEPKLTANQYAIAAWITQGGSQRPIQATGGYLTASN